MKKQLSFPTHVAIYVLFALFWYWLAAQIPYTHDDWDWGLPIGLQHLMTADINSRYAGNFFVVLMTRSEILKTLIMGTGCFLIPLLLAQLTARATNNHDPRLEIIFYLAANILLLTMNRQMWAQTYGWVSGFANFSISAVFMLLCLIEWCPILNPSPAARQESLLRIIFFTVISLLGELFIENLALIMPVAAFLSCWIYYRKTRRISWQYTMMCLGSIAGLIIMFSSPMYITLLGTGHALEGVRHLSLHTSKGLLESIYDILFQYSAMVVSAGEKNVVLAVCSLLLLMIVSLQNRSCKTSKVIICCIFNTALIVYFLISHIWSIPYSSASTLRTLSAIALNTVYFLLVIGEVFTFAHDTKTLMNSLLVTFGLAAGTILPLLATDERGSRLLFSFYILMILFILILLRNFLEHLSPRTIQRILGFCLAASILLCAYHTRIYVQVSACNTQRLEIISAASQTDAQTITLPSWPHSEYMWNPDPINDSRWEYYRAFYGINDDVEIVIE